MKKLKFSFKKVVVSAFDKNMSCEDDRSTPGLNEIDVINIDVFIDVKHS